MTMLLTHTHGQTHLGKANYTDLELNLQIPFKIMFQKYVSNYNLTLTL